MRGLDPFFYLPGGELPGFFLHGNTLNNLEYQGKEKQAKRRCTKKELSCYKTKTTIKTIVYK